MALGGWVGGWVGGNLKISVISSETSGRLPRIRMKNGDFCPAEVP